ncbi:hypothetical protein [Armatimonas sp.]|uniref:hypothetical protein n=1 Tax=Armatimonas sp. TaxID=1872638 RepID=UPI00374FECD4
MILRRDEDLTFQLTLPRAWFRSSTQTRLPERLTTTVELVRGSVVLRLLGMPQKPDEPTLDFSGRVQAMGGVDQGQGRFRVRGSAAESVEVSQALDGSLQLQRSGLRGAVTPAKNSLGVVHEALLWFGLGRLLRRGSPAEQALTLLREEATPGLLSGTLFLTEEREEPLKLRDEVVMARRLRYRTLELGYPKERERGALWMGPQGEVLKSELLPQQTAVAAMALEKGSPAFVLKALDGASYRAEQGTNGWAVSHSVGNLEAELDFERRLRRVTSRLTGTPLNGEWDGTALRYAYPSVLPRFVTPPKDGSALFLASLLLPEPLPRLVIGEKRPVLLLPMVTGESIALDGEFIRLPDTPKKTRSYRLTLDGSTVAELESDSLGLVRLTSNGALAITRKN